MVVNPISGLFVAELMVVISWFIIQQTSLGGPMFIGVHVFSVYQIIFGFPGPRMATDDDIISYDPAW